MWPKSSGDHLERCQQSLMKYKAWFIVFVATVD